MAIPYKKDLPNEERILRLEYFEEKTERHISEMKEIIGNVQTDVTDIKNAIIGNKMNGDNGIVFIVSEMKKQQVINTETLVNHKTYFSQIAWFIGIVTPAIILILIKLFVK